MADRRVVGLGLFWLVLVGLLCWRFRGAAPDDMFITYRYAQNLVEGRGFLFNPPERVYGISDPGVGLALAAGNAVTGLDIPVLGTVLTGFSLLVSGLVILSLGAKRGQFWEAAVGGTLALTSSYLWLGQGSGPLVALALLLLSSVLARHHPLGAGLLAGAGVWCRPESLIGCAILLWTMRGDRRRALLFGIAAGGLAIAGGLLGWRYFGQLAPSTVAVKRQFAALAPDKYTGWSGFWRPAIRHFVEYEGLAGALTLALGLAGVVPLVRRLGPVGWLLGLYCLAQVVLYSLLKIPFFIWYVAPPAFLVLIGLGFGLGAITRAAAGPTRPRWTAATVGILLFAGILIPAIVVRVRWAQGGPRDWRLHAYRAAGEWLKTHSPALSDVAFDEVGILAFYSERRVLDLIGLESPVTVPYAAVSDPVGGFLAAPTTYVLQHTFDLRGGTGPMVSRPWFAAAYQQVARFDFLDLGGSTILYERRLGAELPARRPPFDKRRKVPPPA